MSDQTASRDFENFDQKPAYDKFEASISSIESLNFVLRFHSDTARCLLDTDRNAMKEELLSDKPKNIIRWINLWAPEKQKDVLNIIGQHYGLSPRLLGLMCCDPLKPVPAAPVLHQHRLDNLLHPNYRQDEKTNNSSIQAIDVEGGKDDPYNMRISHASIDLNHYVIANEVWHFCSTDWGPKYLCIGYNSLHNTTSFNEVDNVSFRKDGDKPAGKRIWTWLLLCDDQTVISIHENPYPSQISRIMTSEQIVNLSIIRRNVLGIFRRLSRANDLEHSENPIMALSIRPTRESLESDDAAHISPSESPSLLFYYLFDDWATSYKLVARKEHQYGAQLEQLRARMFTTAALDHVNELHHYGRQLAVLKHIYQSYDRIIQRILDGPKPPTISGLNSRMAVSELFRTSTAPGNTISREFNNISYGPKLGTAAILRFERLKDRIGLYALNEIQDCIEEKEALVQVNFNLIAMKESSAVESLTRITILLAKVTILFMPVSLMTGYFSAQLADTQGSYTRLTYWVAFGVVMAASLIFLIIFGILSGTQEAKPIYKSLTRTVFDAWKAMFR